MSQPSLRLCKRCRVLELNDLALGGCKGLLRKGEERLELPFEAPYWEGLGNIPLEFQLTDTFPKLPKLSLGARSGCDFCKLSKYAIQDFVQFEEAAVVDIHMGYRWSQSQNEELGLTSLIVSLEPRKPTPGLSRSLREWKTQWLKFLIDSNSGKG